MLLVVDANILISVLLSSTKKQDLLFSDEIEAVSPDWLLFEIGKHWNELIDKSGLDDADMELSLSWVREQIETFSINKISDKLEEAKEICPHENDSEYFALALKLDCPIWSEDKLLKKQDKVKVFSTSDIVELLKKPKKKPESEDEAASKDESKNSAKDE